MIWFRRDEALSAMAAGSSAEVWARAELGDTNLGDARLTTRLVRMAATFSEHPAQSIPSAHEAEWHQAKAAYRFFDNDAVEPEEILAAHRRATLRRVEASETRLILSVQDTTHFDFTKHHATEGMGPTGAAGLRGFFLHSAFAVDPVGGVPLGLLGTQWWSRPEEAAGKSRKKRPIEEKESYRWLQLLESSTADLPDGVRAITVADREADIFEFFAHGRKLGQELLVRANHDRTVQTTDEQLQSLHQAAAAAPALGSVTFTVPRADKRPARVAKATLHVAAVTFRPPGHLPAPRPAPVPVHAVLVQEVDAPEDQEPVRWLLLATFPVETAEQAAQCLRWYTYRWRIERLHYTLKSGGGNFERLQLETAERLWRALAVYLVVAFRVLWIDLLARSRPEDPCTIILTDDEWRALYCHRFKTRTPPPEPPTVRTATRWIAALGGFLGRKGDGEPGVKTLWQGIERLHDIVATWRLFQR